MSGKYRKTVRLVFFILLLFLTVSGSSEQKVTQTSRKTVPYHGMRMVPKKSDFYVRKLEAEKIIDGGLAVDIYFNAAVDPRTVALPYLLLNDLPFPDGTTCMFNKAGTEIRLIIPASYYPPSFSQEKNTMKIQLCAATSFNGTFLVQNEFDGITAGYIHVFSKPRKVENK
jgi:hypothetical protein